MKYIFLIVLSFVLLFIPQTVFGESLIPDDYVNDPSILDWSIIFVSSSPDDRCFITQNMALDYYASLTDQYFDKFNLEHEVFSKHCVSKNIMSEVVNRLTKQGDLTIVIPDYFMSEKDRHTTGSLGHYSNWNAHTIVSQSETIYFEDKDTGWTLSHELAHFVLEWKDYDRNIRGEAVHEIQKKYNECGYGDTTFTHCTILWDTIETPLGKWINVMSPSYVIKTAESMKNKLSSSSDQYRINSLYSEFQKKSLNLNNTLENKIYEYQKLNFKNKYSASELENILWTFKSLLNASTNVNNRIDLAFDEWVNGNHNYAISLIENEISYIDGRTPDYNLFDQKINDLQQIESEYLEQIDQKRQLEQEEAKIAQLELEQQKAKIAQLELEQQKAKIAQLELEQQKAKIAQLELEQQKAKIAQLELEQQKAKIAQIEEEQKIETEYEVLSSDDINPDQDIIDQAFEEYEKSMGVKSAQLEAKEQTKQEARIAQLEAQLEAEQNGGGCLIATATYGSEMASEVQQLRELRDNTLLNTESGTAFMESFNDIYYSFSPIIADYERENPVFREIVKIAITPMIASLSILNYVDMNSEAEVLGYGISLILLNLGMYLGVPAVVIIGIRKRF